MSGGTTSPHVNIRRGSRIRYWREIEVDQSLQLAGRRRYLLESFRVHAVALDVIERFAWGGCRVRARVTESVDPAIPPDSVGEAFLDERGECQGWLVLGPRRAEIES